MQKTVVKVFADFRSGLVKKHPSVVPRFRAVDVWRYVTFLNMNMGPSQVVI